MADFVVPRHSAVMERLRRRIEHLGRHHNICESRYNSTAMERLEQERQQTFSLHQRCLQTKAKRSSKHRQPHTGSEQSAQRNAATASTESSENAGGGGGTSGEQSRNSTLIALQETVKRKLENASSPLDRDQVNGFSDGYHPAKKACMEEALGSLNGTSNGAMTPRSPMDSKHGVGTDSLALNGASAKGNTEQNGVGLPNDSDIPLKVLKQEPMDDILPTGGGNGNIILPDLNLNEQEWTELMEEFNRSVPYEEIQELFNDGFEDRKEPDLTLGTVAPANLLPDLAGTIKAEFSPVPASSAYDHDSRTNSPHVPSTSSGPPLHTGSPAMPASTSSPVMTGHQHAQQQPGQPKPMQNHLMPPKDLSPAQQLKHLAAREQQRTQLMQNQPLPAQKPQQAPKFQPSHPSTWQSAPTQSPLGGGTYGLEKPTSPSLYPSDFQNPKSLLLSGQQSNKGSPKAGNPGGYMQPTGHPMLSHTTAPSGALSHPAAVGGQAAMLDYSNTKPLSHFEAGVPRAPANTQSQNKAALLNLLCQHQQQQQQQMKPRPAGMPFRPPTHLSHSQQESGTYPPVPHVPGAGGAMVTQPVGSGMATNHGNAAYLSSLQKQQQQQQQQMQMLSPQQKQFLLGQQRQMLAEQEKQRQEQQLQRHLTRPPPQYQDQQNPSAQQNPFQQQPQVSQYPGSSQAMGSVNSLSAPAPGTQRIFSQNQTMLGLSQGTGPAPVAPTAASQADISLSSCVAGLEAQQVLYGNMTMHQAHANQQRPPVSVIQNYRHNVLAQQQAHLKQQQLARLPNSMSNTLAGNLGSMPGSMHGSMAGNMQVGMPPQAQTWQQQQHPGLQQGIAGQPNPNNSAMPASFSNSGFHMQPRMPKMPGSAQFTQAGLGNNPAARAMVGMNPTQMMPNIAQQRTNSGSMAQQQPQQGQQAPPQVQQVLSDLGPFGQPQGSQVPNRTAGMQCNQAYQVNRTASQQIVFGYNTQSGTSLPSFPVETDLVDSILKNQSTEEWMDDLNELLASHQ